MAPCFSMFYLHVEETVFEAGPRLTEMEENCTFTKTEDILVRAAIDIIFTLKKASLGLLSIITNPPRERFST